jgi:hemoglobin
MNIPCLLKKLLPVLVFVGAVFFSANNALAQPETKEKSLYQRLGSYDAIAAVSDDFIERLGKGKRLGRFVVGLSEDSKKKLRQHLVDFLCNATGGPCLYLGRDMKTVHKGLGIDEEDWKEGVDALVATLEKFKVPEKEKTEVLAAVSSLKGDIVEKK